VQALPLLHQEPRKWDVQERDDRPTAERLRGWMRKDPGAALLGDVTGVQVALVAGFLCEKLVSETAVSLSAGAL
jgi:hypothetical protein